MTDPVFHISSTPLGDPVLVARDPDTGRGVGCLCGWDEIEHDLDRLKRDVAEFLAERVEYHKDLPLWSVRS